LSITDFAWVKKLTFNDFGGQPYFEDFPVLLYIQGNAPLNLDYVDWSHFQEVDGADFRVYDKDGLTSLDYEIETWDDVGKEAWIWAKVPLANRDGADYLWAAYGKSGAVDAQNIVGTWDNNFRMVQHLDGVNWSEVLDSTLYNNDADADNGVPTYGVAGRIDKAVDFDGLDDWIRIPDNADALRPGWFESWFVEFWTNPFNVNQQETVIQRGVLTNSYWRVGFAADSLWTTPGKRLSMMLYAGIAVKWRGSISDVDVCDGNRHHFAVSWGLHIPDPYDPNNHLKMYLDGSPLASTIDNTSGEWPKMDTNPRPTYLAFDGNFYQGLIDEVRVSAFPNVECYPHNKHVRDDDWVKASYDTMVLDFGTWGAEQVPIVNIFNVSNTQLANLRAFPQRSKFYLGVAKGEVLYQAQLSGVADNSPPTGALRLTYSNNPGWEQVRHADEIWVGTTSGTYNIGVVEPVGSTASATQVDVWPTSAPIAVGHYITVRRVNHLWIRPWTHLAVEYYAPVACMGPARLGFVNEALSFDASPSWARNGKTLVDDGATSPRWNWGVDPTSWEYGFIKTHSWVEPGEYWVELYIEDDGGAYHITYRPVLIFNRPGQSKPMGQVSDLLFPYTSFELSNFGTTWGVGQEGAGYAAFGGGGANIRLLEECSIADFPNWMQVVVVDEDWYGDTKAEWGATDEDGMGGLEYAQEVLLTGWLLEANLRQDSATGEVTFGIDRIEDLMNRVEFSEGFTFKAGAGYHAWTAMSAEKILLHMAESHSTLKDIIDIYKPLSLSAPEGSEADGWGPWFSYMDLSGSLSRMLGSQLGGSLGAQLISSRYGTLHLEPNVQFLGSYSPTPMMNFDKRDWWGDIGFRESVWGGVAQIVAQVLDYDIQEMEVKVPPEPESFGVVESITGLIFEDSVAAEAFAERYLDWKNLRFQGITLNSFNNRFLEPTNQPVITITLAVTDTLRGVVWEEKQFIVRAVSYNLSNQGFLTSVISVEEKRGV